MKKEERRLMLALGGQTLTPPPLWLMRQAGRYLPEYQELRAKTGSFWTMCMTPELAVEITLQPIRRFDFDAAIVFSDILTVPYALGCDVIFDEGRGPHLEAVNSASGLNADPEVWRKRLEPVYETLRRLRERLPLSVTLLGFAGAPWTLATYMAAGCGGEEQRAAKLWGYRDPGGFQRLLDRIGDCVAAHLIAQIEAGADAVQIFDSWAGGLPEQAFANWVIAPTKCIVDKVRNAHLGASIIGFPRAITLEGYRCYVEETGVDAISLDTAVPIRWAAKNLSEDVTIQGNLDPLLLVAGGEAMRVAADEILQAMRGRPFIFNLGHGVLPNTPLEHVAHLVAQIRAGR